LRNGKRQRHGGGEQDISNLAHIGLRVGGAVSDRYQESEWSSFSFHGAKAFDPLRQCFF
jgi:hypothetical protein